MIEEPNPALRPSKQATAASKSIVKRKLPSHLGSDHDIDVDALEIRSIFIDASPGCHLRVVREDGHVYLGICYS